MPRKSSKPAFPGLPRISQKTFDHCGPAVLEMLVRFLGMKVDQDQFVTAAKVKHKLKKHGMNIADLGSAVHKLIPNVHFWFKQKATLSDLVKITQTYRIPVGVEWQGVFGKYSDGDDGHYSIVTRINRRRKTITLADPFPRFAGTDRTFTLTEFQKRWWDYNDVKNPKTKKLRHVKDHHMLFIVTSKRSRFPHVLKMKQITK